MYTLSIYIRSSYKKIILIDNDMKILIYRSLFNIFFFPNTMLQQRMMMHTITNMSGNYREFQVTSTSLSTRENLDNKRLLYYS